MCPSLMEQSEAEKQVAVFCPSGCNRSEAPIADPVDQCAACGAIMRPEYERYYDASLAYATGEYRY